MADAKRKEIQSVDTINTPARGLWSDAFCRFLRHRTGMIGAVIVLILIVTAIYGTTVAPYAHNEMSFGDAFAPPSLEHPMGADDFGRDTLSRIMYGARVSLTVGIVSVGLAATVGTLVGMIAGY